MNTFIHAPAQANTSSLKVKGRMMLHEEFTVRLKNLCNSLGFSKVQIRRADSFAGHDGKGSNFSAKGTEEDAVIILSCKISYNPDWGGYCGLPQLLVREKNGDKGEQSPAAFIAPFVQQYRFATEHIYLTETLQGRHLITLPENLLKKDGQECGCKLQIELDKVAEPDEDGAILPVMISGSMSSYALSNNLRQTLDALNFAWQPARSIPIGGYLSSELFSFADIEQSVERNSPFSPSLLPHLRRIVTHRTPNIRAAEIHLRQQFSQAIATYVADHRPGFGNMLCLAGLDIDMSIFRGHEEHYFVPWKAYLDMSGENSGQEYALEQDDLFVRLMQQN
jgi:hypothetical protein